VIAPLKGEVNELYMRASISMSCCYRVCTVFILKTSSILLNQNKASPKQVCTVPSEGICVSKLYQTKDRIAEEQETVCMQRLPWEHSLAP
jgi:hypothetical protein